MRNQIFLFFIGMAWIFYGVQGASDQNEMGGFFPEFSGFQKSDAVSWYFPESLYEYINGAAENYLNYEFQQLGVQNYRNGKSQTLTVEIYRHSNSRNGFGIYSSEKPLLGEYLPVGSQGYQEEGVLNFFHGQYYVKMSGYDVDVADQKRFPEIANKIAEKIGGQPGIPRETTIFPDEGKTRNSERFILNNLFGHPFLKSGFVADYSFEGSKFRAFLVCGKDQADSDRMLQSWLEMAVSPVKTENLEAPVVFQDKYNGLVMLFRLDNRLVGTVNAPEKLALELLKNLKDNLQRK